MSTPERDPNCLFCRIIAGEIPATTLLATPDAVVIADINPQAPVHALAIPRRHVVSAGHLTLADAATLMATIDAANTYARNTGIDATGYRLVMNNGADAGQSVLHLHIHILGGRVLGWPPG